MLKETAHELERIIASKNVIGTPVDIGDKTVIPLSRFGFGFGAAGAQMNKTAGRGGAGGRHRTDCPHRCPQRHKWPGGSKSSPFGGIRLHRSSRPFRIACTPDRGRHQAVMTAKEERRRITNGPFHIPIFLLSWDPSHSLLYTLSRSLPKSPVKGPRNPNISLFRHHGDFWWQEQEWRGVSPGRNSSSVSVRFTPGP
jgi:hypothetical protein